MPCICPAWHPAVDLCTAIPSAKSLHVLSSSTSRSQSQGHLLRGPPCPSVSRTHSPFSTPCLLSSSCLAVLRAFWFVWFYCSSVSLTSVECQVSENKDFLLFATVSPQHLERSWRHGMRAWAAAVGLKYFCGCAWPFPASCSPACCFFHRDRLPHSLYGSKHWLFFLEKKKKSPFPSFSLWEWSSMWPFLLYLSYLWTWFISVKLGPADSAECPSQWISALRRADRCLGPTCYIGTRRDSIISSAASSEGRNLN